MPPDVVGNAIGAAGSAGSGGTVVESGREGNVESAGTEGKRVGRGSGDTYGVLNGTQIYAPADVPINLCGNALPVLPQHSSDTVGSVHGTRLAAPISIPINVSGNSLAVPGVANSAAPSTDVGWPEIPGSARQLSWSAETRVTPVRA